MGASLGNSSTVKAPCEVSNLTMLSFRHTLVTGKITVRAYRTEARGDKLAPHLRRLVRAVLEQQPAARGEMPGRRARDDTQAAERIRAGREGEARLVREHAARQERIVRGDVGRVAQEQIAALIRERLEPA